MVFLSIRDGRASDLSSRFSALFECATGDRGFQVDDGSHDGPGSAKGRRFGDPKYVKLTSCQAQGNPLQESGMRSKVKSLLKGIWARSRTRVPRHGARHYLGDWDLLVVA